MPAKLKVTSSRLVVKMTEATREDLATIMEEMGILSKSDAVRAAIRDKARSLTAAKRSE